MIEEQMDDAALLRRFLREQSDEAFRVLVERHYNMVFGVCLRRLNGEEAGAADAAQSVFIILAQKGHMLRDGDAMANWLYQTAQSVVAQMLRETSRRRAREQAAIALRPQEQADSESIEPLLETAKPLLDAAISSLRTKQREAVVLHFMEGHSPREAAAIIGCSPTTFHMRLQYAIQKLRQYFARHGIAMSAAVMPALFHAENAAVAAVAAKSKAALCATAFSKLGTVGKAAALAHSTVQALAWGQTKAAAAYVVAVLLFGACSLWIVPRLLTGPQAASNKIVCRTPDVYATYNEYCRNHFGAACDSVVPTPAGGNFGFVDTGMWTHVSETSLCVGFETSLPALAHVEVITEGKTIISPPPERLFYLHLHHIRELLPNTEYSYRLAAEDAKGRRIVSSPHTFRTAAAGPRTIHIPEGLLGPPYVLDQADTLYLLTRDLTVEHGGFSIHAPRVTLDLGGHAIVCDSRRAVEAGEAFARDGSTCGGVQVDSHGSGARILNGEIRQIGDATHSSTGFPISIREAGEVECAGVIVDYLAPLQAGLLHYRADSRSAIHHNVFVDRGESPGEDTSACRSQSYLQIGCEPLSTKLHHNLVKRARDCGFSAGEVSHNEVYLHSRKQGSVGILVPAGGTAEGNRVFGVGRDLCGMEVWAGSVVRNNVVYLEGNSPQELLDVGGGSSSLTGIRVKQAKENQLRYKDVRLCGNTVFVAAASEGDAIGIVCALDPRIDDALFRYNTVKAITRATSAKLSACIAIRGIGNISERGRPVIQESNKFFAERTYILWDEKQRPVPIQRFSGCQFTRAGTDAGYSTVSQHQSSFGADFAFLNCRFEDDARAGGEDKR